MRAGDHFDAESAESRYATAFQDYGVDVLKLEPEEAARRIRSSRICVPLIAALDDWYFATRKQPSEVLGDIYRLRAVVRAADPDPQRAQMREALANNDVKALKAVARQVKVNGLPGATLELLGELLRTMGDPEAAVEFLQRAQLCHGDDVWINHNLAMSFRRLTPPRWDEAIRYHEAARALRSDNPGFCFNLAYALHEKGALDGAIAAYREVLRLKPDYAEAYNNLSNALHAKGDSDAAVSALREAIRRKPGLVQAHSNLGNLLRERGATADARAAYEEAIRREPTYASPYCGLGILAQMAGRLDEAIDCYRKAIRYKANYVEAHGNLGTVLRKKGLFDQALIEQREVVRLAPQIPRSHYNLANALAAKKDFQGAITEYREVLRLDPDHAEAHCNLGLVLLGLGRPAGALVELRLGHELGSKQRNWPYPSADWLRQAEELAKQSQQKP